MSILDAAEYERNHRELLAFATRIVGRPEIAEEIVQEAALRLIQHENTPKDSVRAWLFRVVSNLAMDHLRRHSTWREETLQVARERAIADSDYVEKTTAMRGSPEHRAIAREHLSACLTCSMRNLPPRQAATLVLKEINGFTVEETAKMLGVTRGQAKNWLQSARATLEARYAKTCVLVTKAGVCHQCTELDGFFNGQHRDPLEGTAHDVESRLAVVREDRAKELSPWHQMMFRLIAELLSDENPPAQPGGDEPPDA